MPRPKPPRPAYLLHVVPGLESIAAREITDRVLETGPVRALAGFDERTSILAFPYGGSADDLLALRTVEDVFALAAEANDVPGTWAGLRAVREAVATAPSFDLAAAIALERRGRPLRHPTFRVVARLAGEHAFRRVDLHDAVQKETRARRPDWRLVEDTARIEVWAQLAGGSFVAGIRLSDATMRQRTYKSESLPASLKPTVAAAIALVSQPRPDDIVLDPLCGAGTILIERAQAGRYARLLGGDIDPAAVAAATANVGPRYKPIELRAWDARRLPIEDRSVSVVLANLPFGRQIGSPEENRTLYPTLLKEWARVLAPGGRMVLLTSETVLLSRAVTRARTLRTVQRIPLIVRGLPAAIHLIRTVA